VVAVRAAGGVEAPLSDAAEAPLFVVGPGRSGTTLVTELLDAQGGIAMLPETWMFDTLHKLSVGGEFRYSAQRLLFLDTTWHHVVQCDAEAATAVARCGARAAQADQSVRSLVAAIGEGYAQLRGARVWGEKTPAHLLRVAQIRALFPEGRFVRVVRDPRDIFASYVSNFGVGKGVEFATRSAALIVHYCDRLLDPENWRGSDHITLRYEDLVGDPAPAMDRLCRFAGCSFDAALLDLAQRPRVQNIARLSRHRNLRSVVTSARIGCHREELTGELRRFAEEFLKQEIAALGYERNPSIGRPASALMRAAHSYLTALRTGRVSARERLRGVAKVAAHRVFGRNASRVRGVEVAWTKEDWERRLSGVNGPSGDG
jgi:hypothetical protein